MVDRVVKIRRGDVTRPDASEGVRTRYATEVDVVKINLRGVGQGLYGGNVVTVRNADSRKAPPQRIAGGNREAMAILRVIQQILCTQAVIEGNQILSRQDGSLSSLIEIKSSQINHKTKLQRPV